MRDAIRKRAGDFTAIIVLCVIALAVAGYVLHNERLRFPFIQSEPFKLKAELATAQAVVAGQGQRFRRQLLFEGGERAQIGAERIAVRIDRLDADIWRNLRHGGWHATSQPDFAQTSSGNFASG